MLNLSSQNPENQDDTSVLLAKRMKVTGGPQNLPRNIALKDIKSWCHNFVAHAKKRNMAK